MVVLKKKKKMGPYPLKYKLICIVTCTMAFAKKIEKKTHNSIKSNHSKVKIYNCKVYLKP